MATREDEEISEEDIEIIAGKYLTDWEKLRAYLKLGYPIEKDIKRSNPGDYGAQKRQFMLTWKYEKSGGATYRAFIQAAEKAGMKKVADSVRAMIPQGSKTTPARKIEVEPDSPGDATTSLVPGKIETDSPNAQEFDLSEKRGLAIIISCDYKGSSKFRPLLGTAKDAEEMRTTFQQFDYDIHQLKNEEATLSNIEQKLERLGKYLRNYNGATINRDGRIKAIVFTFSGHGADPNLLITNDGESLFLKDVIEPLVDSDMKIAFGIPKLFMIDACRGSGELSTSDDGVGAVGGNYRLDFATLRDQTAGADDDESVWMPVLARDLRRQMFKDRSYQALVADANRDVFNKFGQQPQVQENLTVGALNLYYKA